MARDCLMRCTACTYRRRCSYYVAAIKGDKHVQATGHTVNIVSPGGRVLHEIVPLEHAAALEGEPPF